MRELTFRSRRPRRKCDALGVGTAIAGFTGLAGTYSTNSANKQIAREQMAWQSAENDKDRQWQSNEWSRQFSSENEEWERRFNLQNEYNDPSAVIARLQAAGINPAAAMGQLSGSGGLAAAGGSSQPAAGAYPGGHAVSPLNPQMLSPAADISRLMEGLSSLKKSDIAAGHLKNDTARLEALLPAELALKWQEVASAELRNAWQAVENAWQGNFRDAELQKLLQDTITSQTQGNLNNALAALDKAMERATELQNKYNDASMSDRLLLLKDFRDKLKASASADLASAEQSRESAKTVADLREGQVEGQSLQNNSLRARVALDNIEVQQAIATNASKINALLEKYEQEGYITKKLAAEAEMAIKNKDWQTFEKILNAIDQSAGIVAKGVDIVGKIFGLLPVKGGKIGF